MKLHLNKVLAQDYGKLEIIVSDDHSTDNTSAYISTQQQKWIDKENIDFLYHKVKENKQGKKQALSEAIAHSRHSWVLLTDADCFPNSDQWAKTMMQAAFSPKTEIILGYSPIVAKNTWVSQWAHFEGWLTALQYLSLAVHGRPYMGVGRNLAYKKELVTPQTYDQYADLASGDDDLTIMQVTTPTNTAICLDPESFVKSPAPDSWSAYYRQKTRHYSTASSYKWGTQFLLAGYSLSHVLFFVLVLALVYSGGWMWGLGMYSVRLLFLFPVVNGLKRKMEAQFSLLQFVMMDFFQCFYYLVFSFAVLFPQKNKW